MTGDTIRNELRGATRSRGHTDVGQGSLSGDDRRLPALDLPHLRRLALRAHVTLWRLLRMFVVLVLLSAISAGCGGTRPSTTTVAKHPRGASTTTTAPPAAREPAPTGFDPVSFTAISPSDFWLLGAVPCANPVCASILRTTDGGRHFVTVAAPPVALSTGGAASGAIDTLRFATTLDGYAFDAQSFRSADDTSSPIWETTDGGSHWRQTDLRHVLAFATGGGFAYVVTGDCREGVCRRLLLRRAVLGTDSWNSTALPVGTVDPIVALTVHSSSVWLSVSPTKGRHPYQVLLASADDGSSFTTVQSPCGNGLGGQLAATSSSVLWAVCPTGMLAGALRSTDGGATWASLTVGRVLSNGAQITPANDTSAVVAIGDQTELLRTTDGGTTFKRVYPVRAGFWDFIGFTDGETGAGLRLLPGKARAAVGLSPHELLRTRNGGRTWAVVEIR
jgi:hypothetical protein